MRRRLLFLAFAALQAGAVLAQSDPFAVPLPRPASPGAYQWGMEMLRFDRAWAITRGRAHVSLADQGFIRPNPDLGSGLEGPLRPHLSMPMNPIERYHGHMTLGVLAARGNNGAGISGACPNCSVSMQDAERFRLQSFYDAVAVGAVAINYSAGAASPDVVNPSCGRGTVPAENCRWIDVAEERDVVFVTIAGNNFANRIGHPANEPTVIGVAGLQPDGQFWTQGYHSSNPGSNYGPEVRLVAPSRDVLTTHPVGAVYFDFPPQRCGDRFDSTLGETASLPASYAGFGDCTGTSFAAPHITGLVGLMRSANPLLTAAETRAIINETATRPVAGPAGSGLTFYIPDAEAAVRRALGPGVNRVTPVFSLFASASGHHLFTSSPQAAVSALAGELRIEGLAARDTYASFGDPVAGYPQFKGRVCSAPGVCTSFNARSGFSVFTTEHSPTGAPLVPLYRMSQSCTAGAGCATTRAFAYATSDADARALQARGYVLDMIEGYVYAPGSAPAGTRALCLAFDAARIDHILYTAAQCDRTQLRNTGGESTGGAYANNVLLGFAPDATAVEGAANQTGMWWNAAESGWGINFAHQGDVIFGTLFTYDAARKPLWLILSEGRKQPSGAFVGTLYRTTGSRFDANPFPPITPGNVTPVGQMRITFAGTGATLEYDVNGAPVTKAIEKQVFGLRAADCTAATGSRAALTNYQDIWWNAGESGWGINLTQQGDTMFASLFTYGLDGSGLWLVMTSGKRQPDGAFSGDLYRTTGPAFNAQPFTPIGAADVTRVGTMRLAFTNGETGTLQYSVDGISVTKAITRQVFGTQLPACSG
ncbi:hypothetical protein DSM104443_00771 [Usitatibacter rugosus]|uniref:Peptidase S8/S53 domain-containing protein n=1 Tax=Usitatibacter rugosus TaxID=2732067 RepID=A0A6M4GR51_9PROT|nr:S8 family serine peptidase [Usitatibacter rugosus]QJR09721.1 hypothetical protein DSM104443_00771 [Usitatibacter rugosus]